METLHAVNIAHLDVKLENCLITDDGDLVLADFGLSSTNPRHLLFKKGSAGYMSPQIEQNQPYDGFHADFFALGVLAFILTVGRPPFAAADYNDCHYRPLYAGRPAVFWKR